ncbi:MAG TPA: glycerophosphodiester phosphodiesterase [Anaerolineae bacterium]|nr:glycerophosphodiester phosphodiesterase [Anaerolineae bacterium]
MNNQFLRPGRVLVYAHRGGGGLAPENTMAAFRQAAEMGVDGLELDVHVTADGVVVVSHDPDLGRMTDREGVIREMTLAEVQAADAGYRWSDDGGQTFPFRGRGERIPTLEAVLGEFNHLPMSIDLKQHDEAMIEPFVALVKKYKMENKLVVGSFDQKTLRRFQEVVPQVVPAATLQEARRFFVMHKLYLSRLYRGRAGMFSIPETSEDGKIKLLSPRLVADLKRQGLPVHIWTVNEEEQMERLITWGVDALITDYPDRALRLLGRANFA